MMGDGDEEGVLDESKEISPVKVRRMAWLPELTFS